MNPLKMAHEKNLFKKTIATKTLRVNQFQNI